MSVKKTNSFYILLLLAFTLVSCKSDVKEVSVSDTSFSASQVQGSSQEISSNEAWSHLYRMKNFNFKTCLQDSGVAAPIQAQEFTISSNSYAQKIIKTDYNGCLVWQDEVSYTHSKVESEISKTYTIKNNRDNSQSDITIIVNPWTGNVFDSRYYNSVTTNKQLLSEESNLFIENFRIQALNGKNFEYLLNLTPKLRRSSLKGSISEYITGSGSFNLEINIYKEQDSDDQTLVKVASIEKVVQLKDSSIKTNLNSNRLATLADVHTTFHFEVNLTPIDTNDISSYKGVIKSRDIQAASATDLREFSGDYSNYVNKSIVEAKINENSKRNSFIVEKIHSIHLGAIVKDSYNSSSIKTVRVNFNACLIDKNKADGMAPLANTLIQISNSHERTDKNGCLSSFIVIDFDQDNPESKWNSHQITFRALDGKYKGLETKRVVGINPFSKNKVGYDLDRETPPEELESQKPSIYLSNFGYEHNGNNTNKFLVDKFFHLTLKKKIRLTLYPKLYAQNANELESKPRPLTHGDYNLKVAVLFPKENEVKFDGSDLSQFFVLSSTQTVVSVDVDGKIETNLEIPFKASEVQYLGAESLFYIEMTPKNEKSAITKSTFIGKFEPLKDNSYSLTKLEESEELNEIRKHVNKIAKYDSKVPGHEVVEFYPESTLDMFRHKLNDIVRSEKGTTQFIYNNLSEYNNSSSVNIKKSELRTLTNHNGLVRKSLLSKFCLKLYNEDVKRCMKDPRSYIMTSASQHINSLRRAENIVNKENKVVGTYKKANYISSLPSTISRSKAFAVREGERYYKGGGEHRGTSFSAGLNPFYMGIFASASKSYEMYTVEDEGALQVAFGGNSAAMSLPELKVDNLKLSFSANVNDCAVIKRIDNLKLIHLCMDEPSVKNITEEWFFISEASSTENTAMSNGQTANDFRFRQVIRGRANFNKLWNNLENEAIMLVVQDMDKMELSNTFKKYQVKGIKGLPFESYNDNSFPGLFTPEN